MLLTEIGGVPQAALPVAALRDHLRMGTGFADDALQDGLLESYLRAALAVVEGRTAKVLIARSFRLELADWRQSGEQPLPIAPVMVVTSVELFDAGGVPVVVDPARYRLVRDGLRPKLVATGLLLPMVPTDGRIEVVFAAGFGATWAEVPADLRQAVFLLAADFYEHRHDAGREGAGLPQVVQALIERWRTVRTLAGGGR